MNNRISGKATTSLVCGILSIVLPFLGFVLGILAIIFGIISRNEIKRSEGQISGSGMATAGLICGIVGLAMITFWISTIGIIFGVVGKIISEAIRSWGGWYYY